MYAVIVSVQFLFHLFKNCRSGHFCGVTKYVVTSWMYRKCVTFFPDGRRFFDKKAISPTIVFTYLKLLFSDFDDRKCLLGHNVFETKIPASIWEWLSHSLSKKWRTRHSFLDTFSIVIYFTKKKNTHLYRISIFQSYTYTTVKKKMNKQIWV